MIDRGTELDGSPDDACFVVAGAASASARRNHPTWMFFVAVFVLVLCAGWMVIGLVGVSSADERLREQESQLNVVREVSANLAAIRRSASDPARRQAGEPLANILQRIDLAGESNQLDLPIARESSNEVAGTIERQYIYSISDDSLSSLLGWVKDATATVPGLEVHRISLNPRGDRAWQLDITFVRYERAS